MGEFAKKLGVAVRAALLDSPELLRQPDRLKEIARKAVVESTTMFDRTALQQLVEAKDPNPWVQDLYGKDAIPFSDLPDGAEFRMPKSDSIKVKLKGNRYTDKGGSKTFKTGMGSAVIPVKATDESLDEKSPPGWKGTVKAMKKHMPDDKAFALAWSMKKKGMKPHYKMGKDGEPVKKDEDFRSAVAELRGLIGEGRSPYARAYARHSSGDPQDDSIEPEYDTDAYEELLAEMPEFLRDALSDPDETSEVDRRGTTGTLSATVKLKDLPTLHLPQDSAFSARIYATKHGEEDADEDGYTWATSTVVGFELETEDEDDGFGEEAPSTRALLSKLRANMREFIAAVKASVPEQYHNKLK